MSIHVSSKEQYEEKLAKVIVEITDLEAKLLAIDSLGYFDGSDATRRLNNEINNAKQKKVLYETYLKNFKAHGIS